MNKKEVQKRELQIPKHLVPKEYHKANYGGVYLVFLTGNSIKTVQRKIKQLEKLVELVKI